MDDDMLIELVRKQPALYDLSHRKYMDSNLKSNIWNDIGRELGLSGDLCKSRWFNIRDIFRKSIQKSGQGRKQIKRYKYHEQLQFLIKYMGDINNIENVENVENIIVECDIPESPASVQAAPSLDPDLQHTGSQYRDECPLTFPPTPPPASQHSGSLADPPASSISSSARRSRGGRKDRVSFRTGSSDVMDYLIRQNEHPVDLFLASLAPILKELHPCDLFAAKSEMYAVVQKYELKLLKEKYPAQDNQTSARQISSSISNTEMTNESTILGAPIVLVNNSDDNIADGSQTGN